ncbi:hypothetical protein [Bacillus paranthracis]|uniref:hypothetical protein n=1 Tax=Bacillus paranthracis TaxID=2026186 RepID=UPI0021D03EEE|nr:hypothetical protein [Bacillus paranthracis]MCU5202951.1 hypothetical protein [Bacillus paranthracis]
MPNCDWGRPCDCKDCRTDQFSIICSHCGFNNVLNVLGSAELKSDKKGSSGYEFTYPSGTKELNCYCCSKIIPDVRYYDGYNEYICKINIKLYQNKLNGLVCSSCGVIDGELKGIKFVKLIKFDNKLYCQKCIIDAGVKKIPNPSNENEKYVFNGEKLKWELHKIRIPCPSCHKKRWLNAENRWKTLCKKCYLTS